MKLKDNTMKFSENTLNLLKNFASINQSIVFKQGNSLRSISVMKNILAEAIIEEDIPKDFGIYDLPQFLNTLALHKDCELDFTSNDYVLIREGKTRSKYFFSDPNVIVTPPDKTLTLPTQDVCFELGTQGLDKLKKAASILHLPDLSVIGESGVVKLVVRDKKNSTSNDFSLTVGETDVEFVFNFRVENLKIIPGSYNVVISQKLLSQFETTNGSVKYFVALEPDSTFG
jgi:hypothetical protein